jgi:2-polyprenyl-3-methyl-5-hydroxy-6-metoxy-1,4-benzoquinol methylase
MYHHTGFERCPSIKRGRVPRVQTGEICFGPVMKTNSLEWQIGEIPFQFTPLKDWQNNFSLPARLPFCAGLDVATATLIQKPSAEIEGFLERAYSLGSVFSGMMEETGLGRSYADDFLQFVLASVPGELLAAANVLEIGCGTGYLLSRVKAQCTSVLGIEPGGHSRSGAEEHGVPIVHDFFPSTQVIGQFDIVLSYGVLEHIQDPVSFLKSIANAMRHDAFLILAVPDCEPYIQAGDISMFWHEHWNYFTGESLRRTLLAAGFELRSLRPAGFGGCIYALAVRGAEPGDAAFEQPSDAQRHEAFVARGKQSVQHLGDFLATARRSGKRTGFYVPGRVINLLSVTGADLSACRFFDDNQKLWGTYYPGIPIGIENRSEWAAAPPDLTIIMSKTFGQKIRSELELLRQGRGVRIVTWYELFDGFRPDV